MLTRRAAIGGSGAFLALAACGRGGATRPVLRVGSQKGSAKALLLSSGLLQGASYDVEWSEFPAAQNLLEAIGSGAVDVGLIGDAPFQFAYQSGSPIKAVSAQATATERGGVVGIVVPASSSARSIRDLVGKRIASTRGSIGHYLVLRALQAAGLPASSVKMTYLSPSDSRAALQTGAIDAWATWLPYIAAAEAEGARIAVDGKGLLHGLSFDVANEAAIASKRDILRDFTARETKALAWSLDHADEYAGVLSKETGLPVPIARETIVRAGRTGVPIDDALIRGQQEVFDTFRASGEVKGSRPVADAFVKQL